MKHLVSLPINPILNVKHASIDTIARNGTWNCCQAPNTAPASLQLPALCKMCALCSYVPMCATHRNLCNDALCILCKYVQVQGRKTPSTASVLFNWPHCAKCVQLLNMPLCSNVPMCSNVCIVFHCVHFVQLTLCFFEHEPMLWCIMHSVQICARWANTKQNMQDRPWHAWHIAVKSWTDGIALRLEQDWAFSNCYALKVSNNWPIEWKHYSVAV